MNAQGLWMGAVLLSFSTLAAAGTGTLPGASLDRPGADTVGAPPGTDPTTSMWTDANGDGLIQKSEIKPGTQLEKRFATRDANKDGTLTRDEYYY